MAEKKLPPFMMKGKKGGPKATKSGPRDLKKNTGLVPAKYKDPYKK